MAEVSVVPKVALIDEPVQIQMTGLKAEQCITITSHLMSERGELFRCNAHYRADKLGVVDLSQHESVGGMYTGIEPMGLFWAMKPSYKNERDHGRLTKQDVCSPLIVTISVYDSHIGLEKMDSCTPIARENIERWHKDKDVERIPVHIDRVRGTLFKPPGIGPFPGMIDLFGTAGGLLEFRASLLASHGYVALALAYFAYDDLPATVSEMDLEYFEQAKDYLLDQDFVCKHGIAVLGVSMGGVIALAMASYIPRVICAVIINASVCMHFSTLTYKGRIWDSVEVDLNRCSVERNALNLKKTMVVPGGKQFVGNSCLEFFKTSNTFLFIYSGDDKTIDDYSTCALINEYLDDPESKCNCEIIRLPGAGHLLEPPFSPHFEITHTKLLNNPQLWGGITPAHAKAQEYSWKKILDFLHKQFHISSKY